MALRLDTDIQYLKGVGPKLGTLFSRNGIKTVGDLLLNFPRAYEDRRAARNIASLKPDDIVSVKACIVGVSSYSMGRSSRKIYDVLVRDASGQIRCKYFRVPYKGYFERFKAGDEIRVVGKVTNYRGRIEFHHPDIRDIDPEEDLQDALIPVYVEIEGLSSAKTAKLVSSVFTQVKEWPQEKLPLAIVKKNKFISREQALYSLHHPEVENAASYNEMKSAAHSRIIYEEFFWLELYLASKKSGLKNEKGFVFRSRLSEDSEDILLSRLQASLPFQLTGAQLRAFAEVKKDLESGKPMNRLVQGDVGSGKTLVSFMSALKAFEAGFQSCLMAPTEILAEQHFRNAEKVLAPIGLKLGLLTGKTKAKERKEIAEKLLASEIHFLIGTHALIEDWVQFQNLGLVIIDEQHRFGVAQRGILKNKGTSPHFLIMTATPIPRTLAMTVYGDLDVSLIDEMPVGRTPIQTRVTNEAKRPQALQFMTEQVAKGRQAYVVYPLVEESEKIDLKNATEEYEKLRTQFPKIRFGLLHGKMKPAEKDAVMDDFRQHKIDVLVSTTVIEVGVDVPNATLMMIEHAERFGLSQLHQLRGRVGRGEHKSFCVMIMGYAVSEETRTRVEFMEKTNDGFKVAEFDLEIRGPGEFMGSRQSGLAGFKMANLVRDFDLLKLARDDAFEILRTDPKLQKSDHKLLREELLKSYGPQALAGIG